MNRLAACSFAVLASLAPGAVAHAATVATDRRCYADPSTRQDTVTLSGSGFSPGAAFQTTLDGQALGAGQSTDSGGLLSVPFPAPSLDALIGKAAKQHTFTVGAQEGTNSANTTFTVSRLTASFSPPSGRLKTLRVRFSAFGFALSSTTPVDIYLHYVTPKGKLKKTFKLGRGQGDCGSLTTTRRRLFPFKATKGAWKLQLDTSKTYRRGTAAAGFLYFTIGVKVN